MSTIADAATERLSGGRPSRFKSALAAAGVGLAAAAVTYRLLRSQGSAGEAEEAE
jgi:uncharacterized membrane protein